MSGEHPRGDVAMGKPALFGPFGLPVGADVSDMVV